MLCYVNVKPVSLNRMRPYLFTVLEQRPQAANIQVIDVYFVSGITTDVNLLGFERWKFRLWNVFQCTAWVIRSFGQTRWEFICRQVNWCQQILIRARVKFTGRCLYVCLQRVFQFQRNLVCRYRSMSDTRRYAVWLNSSQGQGHSWSKSCENGRF